MSKHLVGDVAACVDDCLLGITAISPGVQLLEGHRVLVRSDVNQVKASGKVTLISGGGSGHEPAHAGYVGPGMLTAAVCGAIFTSPPPDSILAALRVVGDENPAGTLMIVKNYTGDRLNFGLAAERAKAEGLKVEMVVVADDCALTSADKTAGRRGLCGTVLIHKIAGSLAEDGRPLSEIVSVCRHAAQNMGTIGLSLSPCHVPGLGASFTLADDEMELGLGIHGEAGVRRTKMESVEAAVNTMLSHMTNTDSSTHLPLQPDTPVALMVNNLGGTSVLEMNIVAKEAITWLESHGMTVDLVYCGSFMTSLDMAGVSLTLLYMDDTRRHALRAATSAPAWCCPLLEEGATTRCTPQRRMKPRGGSVPGTTSSGGELVNDDMAEMILKAVVCAAETLGNCETQLNTLDTQCGDGDCGTTLRRGTQGILSAAESGGLLTKCPQGLLLSLAGIAESMGGSSGALYSLLFTAASVPLACDTSPQGWADALGSGVQAIMRYGGAEPGDRTMLDSLHAAHQTLTDKMAILSPIKAFELAVKAAEEMAEQTAQMPARAGRASYVSSEHLTSPDPGATAVSIWMRAVYEACKL